MSTRLSRELAEREGVPEHLGYLRKRERLPPLLLRRKLLL
jgi:hypothetical protein